MIVIMMYLKRYGRPLLGGIIVLLLMIAFMLIVSMDFRLVLCLACAVFFVAGMSLKKHKLPFILQSILLIIPFTTVFIFLIYAEIPGFICFAPFFWLAAHGGSGLPRRRAG